MPKKKKKQKLLKTLNWTTLSDCQIGIPVLNIEHLHTKNLDIKNIITRVQM